MKISTNIIIVLKVSVFFNCTSSMLASLTELNLVWLTGDAEWSGPRDVHPPGAWGAEAGCSGPAGGNGPAEGKAGRHA